MQESCAHVIVAGHICLDVIPDMENHGVDVADLFAPGKLVDVGAAVLATGGAVSNTGLALHRLGVPTRLLGKVGADLFGRAVLDLINDYAPMLADNMIVRNGEQTSYSIVINPPGVDRIFLHCPGANDTFCADDVPLKQISGSRLFHFGYPPLMRRMYEDGGVELSTLLQHAKACGATTSLDMASPDPVSAAGMVDWQTFLRRVLPHVDVFLPSVEEILFMLDKEYLAYLKRTEAGIAPKLNGAVLHEITQQLLQLGAAIVGLKLGDQGLYVRTTGMASRLSAMGGAMANVDERWLDRELLAPCFAVDVVGTTGAGDCTIAGFLAALLHDLSPEEVLTRAVAVGACNVEAADATSGVPTWGKVEQRIASGWERRSVELDLPGWIWAAESSIWCGPHDSDLGQTRTLANHDMEC
ncbi:carbohydrate kinase family protein [Alicyclobacillus fodiniaquatilis]|uniref:Carbohydrate kinase family protein n=1 Tax=Alicyclobacillus fodiniaquatilis TaxID=1661150 RepID=A0ABW4JLP0_9BACL